MKRSTVAIMRAIVILGVYKQTLPREDAVCRLFKGFGFRVVCMVCMKVIPLEVLKEDTLKGRPEL